MIFLPYVLSISAVVFLINFYFMVQYLRTRTDDADVKSASNLSSISGLPYLPEESSDTDEPETSPYAFQENQKTTVISQPTEKHLDLMPVNEGEKDLIVTHSDFDGFISGALLQRKLGKKAEISFSSPLRIGKDLTKSSLQLPFYNRIFVADIRLNPSFEKEVELFLKNAANNNVSVFWYDHHIWAASSFSILKSHCEDCIVDTNFKTAAEIIQRRLFQKDEYSERLIHFIKGKTIKSDPDWDEDIRFLLSELQTRLPVEMKQGVISKLAFNEPLETAEKRLIKNGRKRSIFTERIARKKHLTVITHRKRKFIIIDLRTFRYEQTESGQRLYVIEKKKPESVVGMKACREHDADFALILWSNERFSLYQGIDKSVDFSQLFGIQKFAKYPVKIRGHSYAAGGEISINFITKVRLIFNWSLPSEILALIDGLKENF